MLAVVRTLRTKRPALEIKGKIPSWMISRLKREYGKRLELKKDDEEEKLIDIFKTDWYNQIDSQTSPADNMKIYRENIGYSQQELGIKLGNIPRQNISAMENGRRGISKEMAKKLAKLFNVPVSRFI